MLRKKSLRYKLLLIFFKKTDIHILAKNMVSKISAKLLPDSLLRAVWQLILTHLQHEQDSFVHILICSFAIIK